MKHDHIKTDICVVGGGLAGVCAAIAAARLGKQVALIQNRPVLGGNSSSEIRVWVCSATAHGTQRNARETGIMGELFCENQFVNPEGNPYLWDLTVLEAVKREPNIQLFLNTDVRELEMHEDTMISNVTGWQMGSERLLNFTSPLFLDCTGDGLVGYLAGADYRVGREAQHEYGESLAPDVADDYVLGSTILFYTKNAGVPVPFVPPSFAVDISKTSIPEKRIIKSGDNGCAYWWIEWGGELDTIHDNERIRDELWGVIYGIWDYIKNSGKFPEAATMTLEWVGSMPGKRESRRFLGDYVLKQQDILMQGHFDDGVAFGGWSIDMHPPQGIYSYETASTHVFSDGIYEIPYRCLYSRNIENLLFAGRNISASHVAFASTRVMATCATLGEAAGTAAALCLTHKTTPRGLYTQHHETLVQTLLKQDASLLGTPNRDLQDLARQAAVSASSYLPNVVIDTPVEHVALERDIGISLPVAGELASLEVLLDAHETTQLSLEVYSVSKAQNYIPYEKLAEHTVRVDQGVCKWVSFALELSSLTAQTLFVVLKANDAVQLHTSSTALSGVLCYVNQPMKNSGDGNEGPNTQTLRQWNPKPLHRTPICLRVQPDSSIYAPAQVINGWARPYAGANLWQSQAMSRDTQPWLELRWDTPQAISELLITFNNDVNEDLINLHHHRTPFRVIPELVKDYQIEVEQAGQWQLLEHITDNRKRRRQHIIKTPAVTALRLHVLATHGSAYAEIVEVRAYPELG
ncbi:MAG: FAD-dependent oxidoreductase [Deinococcota bacterium]